jgi:hypothetical protein
MADFDRSIYGKAAGVLREDGWTQGALRDGRGRCLIGALAKATRDCGEAIWELASQLPFRSIATWNDMPERTVEDVFTLLKFAEAGELEAWKALYGPEAES